MSTVFDVTSITVDEGNPLLLGNAVDTISVVVDASVENVTITQPDPVESAVIEVPGIQGAPGVQNMYVGLTNPATIPGQEWGMAQKGYIWIEADV